MNTLYRNLVFSPKIDTFSIFIRHILYSAKYTENWREAKSLLPFYTKPPLQYQEKKDCGWGSGDTRNKKWKSTKWFLWLKFSNQFEFPKIEIKKPIQEENTFEDGHIVTSFS